MSSPPTQQLIGADQPNTAPGTKSGQLVLLGAGHAHVHLLSMLAAHPLPGAQVTLVAPYPRHIHSAMVSGFIAGHYALEDCAIPLEPLVKRGGIRWLRRSVTGLNAQARSVQLDDGGSLHFDWLSVNTGPTQNRERIEQQMPGAREHAMFVRPMEAFTTLWPKVAAMGDARALRIAVVGGGAGGIELALAVRHRLPNAALTLLCGHLPPAVNYTPQMQQRLLAAIKKHHITVLQDTAVAFTSGAVHLGCGAELACDVSLLATSPQPPNWLASSGLSLDEHGFLAVDTYQRSTSHSRVFAAGDVSTRMDCTLARSAVYAVRAGPVLFHNLSAAISGSALKIHEPPVSSLNMLSCGERYAIASWRNYSAQGRWVWWLKNWINRRFMAQYAQFDQ